MKALIILTTALLSSLRRCKSKRPWNLKILKYMRCSPFYTYRSSTAYIDEQGVFLHFTVSSSVDSRILDILYGMEELGHNFLGANYNFFVARDDVLYCQIGSLIHVIREWTPKLTCHNFDDKTVVDANCHSLCFSLYVSSCHRQNMFYKLHVLAARTIEFFFE